MGNFGSDIDSFTNKKFRNNDNDFDNDKYQSINNSMKATLSPPVSLKKNEALVRNLESQPHQLLGEPLQANLDSVKRQRYGRPNTNSPFPYMQKRNSKSKQQPLPSTAATSNNNQMMTVYEKPQINGRHSGIKPSTNLSLLQIDGGVNNTFQLDRNQINMVDQSAFLNSSLGGPENMNAPQSLQFLQDQLSQYQSTFSKNGGFSGEISAFEQDTISKDQIIVKHEKQNKINLDTTHDKINKESSVVTKTSYREVTQNQNDSKDLRQRLTRRRKIATEPNSPTNDISDHARQFGFHNQIHSGRDPAVRLSSYKINLLKQNFNYQIHNNYKPKQRRLEIENIHKVSNSIEDSNGLGISAFQSEPLHNNIQIDKLYGSQTDKNSLFLPRLDQTGRFQNQIIGYREVNTQNKDRSDFYEDQNNGYEPNTRAPFSQERKISIQVTHNQAELNKVFKTNKQPSIKSTKVSKIKFDQVVQSFMAKEHQDIYSGKPGIGKYQPSSQLKSQLNEQMIRNKLNRDKMQGTETPSKLDMSLINLNRGSKNSIFPASEVTSPTNVNQGSPLALNIDTNKNLRTNSKNLNKNENLSYNHSKFYQPEINRNLNASELSDQLNQSGVLGQSGQSQFNHRTYSIQSSQNKDFLGHKFGGHGSQFNTIEDVIRGSKEQSNNNLRMQIVSIGSNLDESSFLNKKSSSVISQEDKSSNKMQHHSIKTSKQMPKCFRMNKQQMAQVTKVYSKGGSNTTTHQKLVPLESNQQSRFDSTFYIHKNAGSQRSNSNDVRMSFNNEFSNQVTKDQFQTPLRQSIKFAQNILNETRTSHQSSKHHLDYIDSERDRERMTPAFNARQTYH